MSQNRLNSERLKPHHKILITMMTFVFQLAVITTLFPIIDSMSFGISIFPAMVGGWLYGRRVGLLMGVGSTLVIISYQFTMGLFSAKFIKQTCFGGPVVMLLGYSFGYLRDIGYRYKSAISGRLNAEATKQRLEKQLQQSQKMEAIGTLAGGVAHDMNNILGIIMSSLSVVKHDIQTGQCRIQDIDTALKACRRGRALTKNLLGFARKGTYINQALDINIIVRDVLRLVTPALNKNIETSTNLANDLHPVYGDRSQIEQTLVNICINASEAISNKGTISITTRNNDEDDRPLLAEYGLGAASYAIITISDTGAGMDSDIITHICEPFFTTKSDGKGTGLGLAMAYGTLQKHNGALRIDSKKGKGTTITLMIPSLREDELVKIKQTPVPPMLARVTGHLLLVDDEPLIRSSYERMFKQLGYEVTVADSGEHAILILTAAPKMFDIVILDFVMPGLDGAETLEAFKKINPDIRVFISSGFSKDGKIDKVLKQGALGFIQKPFDMDEISGLLKQFSV